MKNYRIIKGKKIHVNQLASMSRQKTVKNNTIGSELVTVKTGKDTEIKCIRQNGVNYYHTNFTGTHKSLHIADNLYEVSEKENKYGLHFSLVPCVSWKQEKHPQPKRLLKCKKKMKRKGTAVIPARNDFLEFKNFPYTLPKMNKVQYMEKLVEHKLAKWERKNVCPEAMFTEDVEKWKQERENAVQRFRDFVVSIYDNLIVMGNRVNTSESKMKASKIAEVKDVDGKGHDVSFPNLSTEDKLYKNAESAAKKAMKKDASIIDADLMNHKRSQKRPLVGAKRVTLADKKLKKAA
jgi:hypothetical protein